MLNRAILIVVGGAAAAGPFAGCQQLPGSPGQQGAVIGGAGGAIAGAALAENRLLGALIGGALGAGGGYLIGANWDSITGNDREAATASVEKAQTNPATPEQAREAATADVNNDGFVTLDEVVAMSEAGFSDEQMLRRLRATNQVFELTNEQQDFLVARGVSRNVTNQINNINRDMREQLLSERGDVISEPR